MIGFGFKNNLNFWCAYVLEAHSIERYNIDFVNQVQGVFLA